MSDETFEYAEDAIQAVKATVDDIDSVTVLLNKRLAGHDGEDLSDVGMILEYCTGRYGFVSRSLTALLLNDGVFGRLRVPVRFL